MRISVLPKEVPRQDSRTERDSTLPSCNSAGSAMNSSLQPRSLMSSFIFTTSLSAACKYVWLPRHCPIDSEGPDNRVQHLFHYRRDSPCSRR